MVIDPKRITPSRKMYWSFLLRLRNLTSPTAKHDPVGGMGISQVIPWKSVRPAKRGIKLNPKVKLQFERPAEYRVLLLVYYSHVHSMASNCTVMSKIEDDLSEIGLRIG